MRILRRVVKASIGVILVIAVLLAVALGVAWVIGPPTAQPGVAVVQPIDCRTSADRQNPVIVLPGGDGTVDQTDAQWRTMTDTLRSARFCTLVFQVRGADGNRWAGEVLVHSGTRGVERVLRRRLPVRAAGRPLGDQVEFAGRRMDRGAAATRGVRMPHHVQSPRRYRNHHSLQLPSVAMRMCVAPEPPRSEWSFP